MQISTTTFGMHDAAGAVRPGGPDAPAPTGVIAQAVTELPYNFGLHVKLDVTAGAELGTFASIEEARAGARKFLTASRQSIGIVANANETAYRAVELLVPGISTVPFNDREWAGIASTPLRMGADARHGNRFVEQLVALDRPDADRLLEVELPGRTRLEFERTGLERVSRMTR